MSIRLVGVWLWLTALLVGCTTPAVAPGAVPVPPTPDALDYERIFPAYAVPVLDTPDTVAATDAAPYIDGRDLVMGIMEGDEVRAYPLGLLRRYEIVNDVIGRRAITVTYCPSCNIGLAFDRTVDGTTLSFDNSGLLLDGALVMEDRASKTRWSQVRLQGVEGTYEGTRLTLIVTNQMPWQDWVAAHPTTRLVIDPRAEARPDSGFQLPVVPTGDAVNADSYYGYIAGITTETEHIAYPLDIVETKGLVQSESEAGSPLLVVSLGARGAVAAWDRTVEGQVLTFALRDAGLQDVETGSTWDASTGVALDGPLTGQMLSIVPVWITDWRGWFDLYPDTELYEDTP